MWMALPDHPDMLEGPSVPVIKMWSGLSSPPGKAVLRLFRTAYDMTDWCEALEEGGSIGLNGISHNIQEL